MELFKLFGTIALDNSNANKGIDETTDKAEKSHPKISGAFEKIGSAAVKTGKVIAAGIGVGAAAITALVKQSVGNFAEYEQLIGGVETLFGDAQATVFANASEAFRTAGLSANAYMETVTSFSASLIQSLGGDTAKAAEVADKAILDMSDNANKMGSDMESIQNAYQGFAKQNYTMLDNLKLGYGGTKEEMQRLLKDAQKLSGQKFDLSSYADIIEAIHVIQEEMGIAGTTAEEASETISGSLAATKAAWENLVTGISDDNADFEGLIEDFVDSVGTAAENIIPRVEIALSGAGKLVERLLPVIVNRVPQIINNVLPNILTSASNIVKNLVDGISANKEIIMTTAYDAAMIIVQTITGLLPQIFALGFDLLMTLANGIINNLDNLVASASGMVQKIADTITMPETLSMILNTGLNLILALATGLVNFLPQLVDAAFTVITRLVEFLLEPENLEKIIDAAVTLITTLATGLIENVGKLVEGAGKLATAIVEAIFETDWLQVGTDIVSGIADGFKNVWSDLQAKYPMVFSKQGTAFLTTVGSTVLPGMGNIIPSHASGLDYVPYDGYVAELHRGEMVLPADESNYLRSGALGVADKEVVRLLERLIYVVEEKNYQNVSLSVNNREFARLVKAVN